MFRLLMLFSGIFDDDTKIRCYYKLLMIICLIMTVSKVVHSSRAGLLWLVGYQLELKLQNNPR